MKRKFRVFATIVGLGSIFCIFLTDFPYCLIPFAFFLYVFLPNGDAKSSLSEARRRSSWAAKKSSIKRELRPVKILDPPPSKGEKNKASSFDGETQRALKEELQT